MTKRKHDSFALYKEVKESDNRTIDVLCDVIDNSKSLLRSMECKCCVTNQGLVRCRRCATLSKYGG